MDRDMYALEMQRRMYEQVVDMEQQDRDMYDQDTSIDQKDWDK